MRSLLDGDLFDLRCTCGITVPSKNLKFKDLPELIRSLCLHFIIYTAKSELDQLREGLEVLNLLSVMQSNSTLFMPLFVGSNHPQLTADSLLGLFKVKSWSPEGSNSRECEEAENMKCGFLLALCGFVFVALRCLPPPCTDPEQTTKTGE